MLGSTTACRIPSIPTHLSATKTVKILRKIARPPTQFDRCTSPVLILEANGKKQDFEIVIHAFTRRNLLVAWPISTPSSSATSRGTTCSWMCKPDDDAQVPVWWTFPAHFLSVYLIWMPRSWWGLCFSWCSGGWVDVDAGKTYICQGWKSGTSRDLLTFVETLMKVL